MSRTVRIPRVHTGERSVLTGRTWNEDIAEKLEGLRTLGGSGEVLDTGIGGGRFETPNRSRFLPWEIFLDPNQNKIWIHPVGAFVFGSTLDPTGISEVDKSAAASYPSRFGHPWVPKIGANYIDRKLGTGLWPTLTATAGVTTYVWLNVSLAERDVPFGKDFDTGAGFDFAAPVVQDTGGTQELTTSTDDGHNHTVDVSGIVAETNLRVPLKMVTYDIQSVTLTAVAAGAEPADSLVEKHYLVGWIDRGITPAQKRMFLNGPVFCNPPVLVGANATGITDPDGGLVDTQSPLEPRGVQGNDGSNNGRGTY